MKDVNSNILNLIQNMDDDWKLRMAVYLIFAAACIVIGLLIWLLLRGARLWYWKINVQLDKLENIDRNLTELRTDLKVRPAAVIDMHKNAAEDEKSPEPGLKQGTMIEKSPTENEKSRHSVSKNGRIYTEEELEAQIKD